MPILVLTATTLLLASGCLGLGQRANPPATPPKPADSEDPPQVVKSAPAPATQPADPIADAVQSWLNRINAAQPPKHATQKTDHDAVAQGGAGREMESNSAPSLVADSETKNDNSPGMPTSQPASPDGGPAELPLTTATPRDAPGSAAAPLPLPPPQLGAVTARVDPAAVADPGAPSAGGAPQINGAASTRIGPANLRELLDRLPPGDDSFREQLDRRMLAVVAGDFDKARAPLTLVTAEQQELATRFVGALIAVRDWHMGDTPAAVTAATREIGELQTALQKLSELSIPVVKICSAVRGFGQYEAIEPPRLVAGAGGGEFVLYCEVSNFVSEAQKDGTYTTTFDMNTALINRVGDTVFELKDAGIVDRCRNRRRDCFIPRLVRLPASLPPGNYAAKVTITDKLGQKVAENRATLQVAARQ